MTPRGLVRPLRIAAVIVTVWLVAAGFFSWQQHKIAVSRGEADPYTPRLLGAVAAMLIWALFTPPLLALGDRLPVVRPHRGRNAMLVSLAAAAIALLRAFTDVMLGLSVADFVFTTPALFHRYFMYALIVVGIGNFIRLEAEDAARRHHQVRGEAEAAEALLRQLRADLNPHFLFNTMNDVAMLLHAQPRAAEEMLGKLREFLRRAVETEHAREVRLAEELEFVSRYFDIQKMRFGAKLTTAIHVARPHLNDVAVPPLLLQPLIENSIVHGISARRDAGCVTVLVDEERTADSTWLCIEVRDDGPGCTPEAVFARARVGVANAVARLESIYGARQSLTYEHHGDRFVARVLIPLRMLPR